jgi:ABC-type nitrate/sulfonate/bicarbonate transport system permease component
MSERTHGSSEVTARREAGQRNASIRQALGARPGRGRRVANLRVLATWQRVLIGTVAVAVALGFWQLAADEQWINPLVSSSPSGIVRAAAQLNRSGTLGTAVGQTAELFAVGFGISLVTGLALGLVLGWYKYVEAALDPFVSILYASPRIAIIPLITVWAGIGFTAQVVIVWLTAVFPIIINVAAGVSAVDRDYLRVARSFLATNRDVLFAVAIPGALPSVIAGVRQGLAQGLIGVVVAEYFVGDNGIGGLIFNAGQTLETGNAFVGVIIFAAAALVLTAALRAIERRFSGWRL